MKVENIALQEQNKVMQSYNHDNEFIHTYFDYENKESSYPERLAELSTRNFKRKQLAETVRSFMEPFGISQSAHEHLVELEEDAVTVIGGQQAGILTGPLYSVHKAISVILLAKKQRQHLGVPVVPVFWVAGEDHDINEINHVYTNTAGRVTKEQIQDKFVLKLMASDATYDQIEMKKYVETIFSKFGETAYTKPLLEEVLAAVDKENTFTGFFVRLMNGLFAEEGLLFIDSAYKPLRELESEYFQLLIQESETIAAAIVDKESMFDSEGYGRPFDAEGDASHLFYVHETGRMLLTRRDEYYVNESAGLRFTTEEMLEIAKESPFLLSNNVATRPLMQDLVFPVLAFVGGPGEITYWALLKEAFHQLEIKMPIIIPRLSITLVPRDTDKALKEKSLTFQDVISGEVTGAREEFIATLQNKQFEQAVIEAEKVLKKEYEKIGRTIDSDEQMMNDMLKKNLNFHKLQFNYLKAKSEEALLIKHEVALRKFSLIETNLYPNNGLQERSYTPYKYMNEYSPTLIKDLLDLPLEFDGTHKLIYF
ncbi:bacillithiol biosynthesis cysteine-adding enzyme BshC [Sporosarcina sp. Marseille-Q4063]|uniref:bacillithiol biosynthesis cysteine-adding enzyme BshC n=1 Tax=Sporosarcina sp. Marseille-Q4063 TaxID=2810514 RepID=UPI001BAEDB17|nr:bacillithiol biosynthesis cysteine-adding enzyme BshC [Sporosarcina sp. Marseille-Q4063]QUW21792.1 bacillithiol biosynthesis cysteine-adding enzyme BshC [Sporosarcina sp. Marseille-Q4063]